MRFPNRIYVTEQVDENIYQNKFESSHIEAEGIRLSVFKIPQYSWMQYSIRCYQ